MKITSVEYRRLRTFGEYENETVGIVAEVDLGESPDDAMSAVRAYVDEQLQDREDGRGTLDRVRRAESRLREVGNLLQESEKRWIAAQKILAAAGVEVPKDYGDDGLVDLPF